MTLDEFLAALERLGDGDWEIVEVRPAEEEGSGRPGSGAAPPGGRRGPMITPRRPSRRPRRVADRLVVNIWLRIS